MPIALTKTKYFQAASGIRELINTLPPGELLPVASDLEKRFDLSHGATIRALKLLANEGVIYRPFGKQRYVIADRFERISATISMIRPDYPAVELDNIVKSVYEAGQARNWKFNQFCYRKKEELDFVHIAKNSDAIVLLPASEFLDKEFLRILLKPALPVIVLLQHVNNPKINNVCIDNFRVGELAAETLAAAGHNEILLVKDQPAESTMAERLAGFRSASKRLGLSLRKDLFLDTELKSFEDSLETAYRKLTELLSHPPRFSAVFTTTLSSAIAALRVFRENGISVPDDISLLTSSGGNVLPAYLDPPVSSIDINLSEFGEITANQLSAALSGREPERIQLLKPFFVERLSIKSRRGLK